MVICESCGENVFKVSVHSVTKKKLCLKCLIESGSYQTRFEDIDTEDEKRGSIRIPLTFVMDIELKDREVRHSAFSADMSMTGICFAWEGCKTCTGYMEKDIHENCVFYPYYIHNKNRRTFTVQFSLSQRLSVQVPAYAVYTIKEGSLDIEYVGAKFTDLTPAENRIIEEIIIRYAGNNPDAD